MSDKLHARILLHQADFRLHVDIAFRSGVTGVFGASGAGKTTLLRCIAGLERAGDITIDCNGEQWQDTNSGVFVEPHNRPVAYVFQEPRLFPHLDVQGNLEYGLKRCGGDRQNIEYFVDMLGLGRLLSRSPLTLSGGEAKRVAIARALMTSPRVLLLDEPLASLDVTRRGDLLPFLDRLQAELSLPLVYVSHSIEEISHLCDDLVVLEAGELVAKGGLQEVMLRTDLPGLGGADASVVIDAEYAGEDDHLKKLRFSGGDLWVPDEVDGGNRRVRIRANDVSLSRSRPADSSILNLVAVVVEEIEQDSDSSVLVTLRAGDDLVLSRITRRSMRLLKLQPGDSVFAQIKSVAVKY